MATDYPTPARIDTDLGVERPTGGRLRAPALVLGYAVLWMTFTLAGVLVALALAELGGGLTGAVLLVTIGLGAIAAGPVAARKVIGALLTRVE